MKSTNALSCFCDIKERLHSIGYCLFKRRADPINLIVMECSVLTLTADCVQLSQATTFDLLGSPKISYSFG